VKTFVAPLVVATYHKKKRLLYPPAIYITLFQKEIQSFSCDFEQECCDFSNQTSTVVAGRTQFLADKQQISHHVYFLHINIINERHCIF